jgi:hypothetical protein
MGSFGTPGFVKLGWPAMTRQPFANAQAVSSSFVNADILSGFNEPQERGDRFLLPPCSDRACHNAMSAALLNATRMPVLPRLTRILPHFAPRARPAFRDLRILAGPTFELEHSDDLFLFAAL